MNSQSRQNPLILASSSAYRMGLLKRLGIPFSCQAPAVSELPLPGEAASALTHRLALAKANSIADSNPSAVIIGSDQVGECKGRTVNKPGGAVDAVAQLLQLSGQTVNFHTAVAVVCAATGFCRTAQVETEVRFRILEEDEARRYVEWDRPLDCAGSFKAESAGLVLMEAMISNDPTAIIGLPLISLAGLLRAAGYQLP
ncbi:MAG TPA: Maf family nucleotide pyrophosphatase [Xanthomonadales bacterium]|nr:Maf family nucleotide pyrophosphatase [Xanthomonadales bacterium]